MIEIGFHTDAFNSSYWSFEQAADWGAAHGVPHIECGAIDGVSWIHGLGYQPHVALWEDPLAVRDMLAERGIAFSQIDAAFPLDLPEGTTLGVEYVLNTIRWAKLAGIPSVDTTDHRVCPPGMTESEAFAALLANYRRIVPVAERYEVVVNVEPHGHFTTKPQFMAEILGAVDSPFLRMNMDTGNTFIAGQDPVAFLEQFVDQVTHVHVKDVSESLAAASRGELTGIAVSACAIGEGVNAENIRRCFDVLVAHGYDGVVSLECEGSDGLIERSLAWVEELVATAGAVPVGS
jgi:sugar phosphate isomerase/epimerase